jgi:secreted protein
VKHSKTLLSTAGALTLSAILAPSVSADQLEDSLASVTTKEDQLTTKIKEKTAKNHLQTTLQSLVQKDDNSVIETASLKAERLQVMSQKETLKAQIANREKRAAFEAEAKAKAETEAKAEAQRAKEDAEKPKTTEKTNTSSGNTTPSERPQAGTIPGLTYDYAGASSYPVGQCTWGVKVVAPWAGSFWGNADQWPASAAAAGFKTGTTPKVGAIISWSGCHVAYVTDVREDGMIQVVEANYAGNQSIANYRGWFNPIGIQGTVTYIYPN